MTVKRLGAWCTALSLLLCGCGDTGGAAPTGTVTLLGSTSMERVARTLAEQYALDHGGVTITVEGGGSGAGIEAVRDGTADIGLVSRALTEAEQGAGVTGTLLALDGIAVLVNEENPVEDLTLEELAGLYTGSLSTWDQVGGEDLAVAAIGRESGSGTREGFESVTGTRGKCVLSQALTSAGAVVEAVRANPQAIGYASLLSAEGQAGVKILLVEGAACTEEALRDGSYPLQRPFVLVTPAEGLSNPKAQAFFDYITSPAAHGLIRMAGAAPVS